MRCLVRVSEGEATMSTGRDEKKREGESVRHVGIEDQGSIAVSGCSTLPKRFSPMVGGLTV